MIFNLLCLLFLNVVPSPDFALYRYQADFRESPAIDESGIVNYYVPDHQAFTDLLRTHVNQKGEVDYPGFKMDMDKLQRYLDHLSGHTPTGEWSESEQLAYWINVYNAFTIKLILDHYPVGSITEIDQGKPWDTKWIPLGDATYSLNQIENEIIRPDFNEPRIHFALNCAAKSCPPLANEAFTSANLESLLEKRTGAFINNSSYNKIAASSVSISKIFDWYGSDFGNLISFLNKYSTTEIKPSAKVSFNEYDWGLNKQ